MPKKVDPYGIVEQEVLCMKGLSMRAKLVYCLMRTYANNGNECFPSQKVLTDGLGVSRDTVIRAISDLIKAGVIKKERKWKRNHYIFLSSSKSVLDQVANPDISGSKSVLDQVANPDISGSKSVLDNITIPVTKPKGTIPISINNTGVKNLFYDFYKRKFGVSFKGWNGKEATNLNRLIKKLQEHLIEISAPGEFDENFEALMEKAMQDTWIRDRFRVSILNLKFDEIVQPQYDPEQEYREQLNAGIL